MAIDFPNSPSVGQIYTVGSRSWKWDGTIWATYANNPVLYRQDTAPSSPQDGDQWFETDTGRWFVYHDSVWVEIGNATDIAGALQPKQITDLSAITTLTSDDVFAVVDNPSSATATNKITYGNLVTNMSSSLASGLVLIKTQTIGTGVSNVTVSNVFSSTYDTYKVTITGFDNSVNGAWMAFRFDSSHSSNYYGVANLTPYNSTQSSTGRNNAADGLIGRTYNNSGATHIEFTVANPFQSTTKSVVVGQAHGNLDHVDFSFMYNVAGSFTGFYILTSLGTITGGTIRVYGFRNS